MIEIINASNLAVDFAIAKLDKKNEGLSFGFVDGIFSGYFIEDQKIMPATYLVGFGWSKQMKVKKNHKFVHAISYCPTSDWTQASTILTEYKVGFYFDKEKNKWISSVNKIEGEDPIVVALKDILKTKYGDYLDLGEEAEQYLQLVGLKT